MFNTLPLTGLAASWCRCMDVPPPGSAGPALDALCRPVLAGRASCDRLLIYNPDALGMWLCQKYAGDFAPVRAWAPIELELATVMPAVTPVCFASMYTGARPQGHGIQKYEKPVVKTPTLFDALSAAGKRTALVAVQDSSLAVIFGGRKIDYHILPDDGAVVEKALELIEEDRYDCIVCYNQDYDDAIHDTVPESADSLAAMRRHIADFDRLAARAKSCWSAHDTLLCFAPDHGTHIDETGHGNHGDYIPEDINILHFYGVLAKEAGR